MMPENYSKKFCYHHRQEFQQVKYIYAVKYTAEYTAAKYKYTSKLIHCEGKCEVFKASIYLLVLCINPTVPYLVLYLVSCRYSTGRLTLKSSQPQFFFSTQDCICLMHGKVYSNS